MALSVLRAATDTLMAEPTAAQGRNHEINCGADRQFLHKRHRDFPDVARILFSDQTRAVASIALEGPLLFNEQFGVKGSHTGASFT